MLSPPEKKSASKPAVRWMNLEDASEISQIQKGKHSMIPLLRDTQNHQIHRQMVEQQFPGAGDREQ